MQPDYHDETSSCLRASELLGRIANKWTLLIVRELGTGPKRFNLLRRDIGDISQKMLSSTLKSLERDGIVIRDVTPTMPPQVEYSLTALGRDMKAPVEALASWAIQNADTIDAARKRFDMHNHG
ncbi:transcriptional regulator, HxlR family [Ketogulonicigenium robustum]|uniref:Transcriptional regulator, HxlR family n=1 Tax=Ketogulonicigenium robustum TaxID=92947 RepID=A0A1W6P021_9RHOB|nr:helix-turn-helix domain-containing protein [Ketogulonicigenium robustum]ARO14804.1 transcriptional regulator, HxlR family [Ketogulonicigenium robustum]